MQRHGCHVTGTALPPEISSDLRKGLCSPRLEGLLRTLLNSDQLSASLQAYLGLLADCHMALGMVRDAGFEAALQFLGRQCLAAVNDAGTGSAQQQPQMKRLLKDLADRVWRLWPVLQSLGSGLVTANLAFPKLQALVTFLTVDMAGECACHGIVFVRERESVHTLTHRLEQVRELAGEITFHPFTGHGPPKHKGVTAGRRTSWPWDCGIPNKGMKTKTQSAALHEFRHGKGRHVLVATAAAEEGLDIVNCQFVICFTVVESGRELIQRRGRARMPGSRCVHIVERGSRDEGSLLKAQQEERNACDAQCFKRL